METTEELDKEEPKFPKVKKHHILHPKAFGSFISAENVNKRRLCQALSDIGDHSSWSGIAMIEAWVLNDKKTSLIRPDEAYWRDPGFRPPFHMDQDICRVSLQQLENSNVDGYQGPKPLHPGFGVAGHLWAEKNLQSVQDEQSISKFGSFHGGGPRSSHSHSHLGDVIESNHKKNRGNHLFRPSFLPVKETLIWRGLHFMRDNPHHISDNRLELFLEAGFGQVAGVPFDLPGSQGILLFFAKLDVDTEILDDKRNVQFLKASAPYIGSILALSEPTTASLGAKQEQEEEEAIRFEIDQKPYSVIASTDNDGDVEENMHTNMGEDNIGEKFVFMKVVRSKLQMLKDKFFDLNTGAQPPPPMSSRESLWTLIGSFITLLFSCYASEAMAHFNGTDIPIGPIGAFATLLYGLTSAPPGQPRNAFYGSAIAGCTALLVSHMPSDLLNLRISLAASISITLMARVGVIHPPGGALAVMLSMGNYTWISLVLYQLTLVVVICIAIVINNLNEKRKYPQYWNMVPKAFDKGCTIRIVP